MNEVLLRSLTPSVLGILIRRGADFAAAEDAVQDALVEAVRVWSADPPRDRRAGWSPWPGAGSSTPPGRTPPRVTHAKLMPKDHDEGA